MDSCRRTTLVLCLEDLSPTHMVGHADMGHVVVVECTGVLVYVHMKQRCVDWIEVSADALRRRRSAGTAHCDVGGVVLNSSDCGMHSSIRAS